MFKPSLEALAAIGGIRDVTAGGGAGQQGTGRTIRDEAGVGG